MKQIVNLARGPKGEQGDTGQRGARGPAMSGPVRRAIVYLCVGAFTIGGANLLWTNQAVNSYKAGQAAEQATAQRQGEMLEHKLCTTFGSLAALKPPPGNPHTNPSRAYEQGEHAILDQVGPDLQCPKEQP
jgi:hypothetical protein